MKKVNLGCGHIQPPGWVNVDGSKRAWLASRLPLIDRFMVAMHLLPPTEFNSKTFYANLKKAFPFNNEAIGAIYAGEILEHFTREEGEKMLKECFRVLVRGGIIRIRVPDNAQFWENYLNEFKKMKDKSRSDWTLDHTRWIEMFFHDICVRPTIFSVLMHSAGHFHKWLYDEISLIKTLERCRLSRGLSKAFSR